MTTAVVSCTRSVCSAARRSGNSASCCPSKVYMPSKPAASIALAAAGTSMRAVVVNAASTNIGTSYDWRMDEYGPATYGERVADVYDEWYKMPHDVGDEAGLLTELAAGGR